MLLAIDAGNTNIVFALSIDGAKIDHVWRCKTDAARTGDEYQSWLHPLFTLAGLRFNQVTGIIISSVVPDANFNLLNVCKTAFGVVPMMVRADTIDLTINLPRPQEAGADRLVNAVAVARDYGTPAIVLDFGTATTFDVVNDKGEFCGGVIAPGINLSITALQLAAARLPRIAIQKPDKVIGTDTVGAMQSGVYWGYVGLVEGLLTRISAELGGTPHIVATGGLAPLFAESIPMIQATDSDLTLRGLLYIFAKK